MKTTPPPKPRAVAFSLIATACALSLVNACSHKQSDASADAADSDAASAESAATADEAPPAGTDAAPPAADVIPAQDGTTQTQSSTDSTPPDNEPGPAARPARKHRVTQHARHPKANSALNSHAPVTSTPIAQAQPQTPPPAPAVTQSAATPPPVVAMAQSAHPETAVSNRAATAARNPASPTTTAPDASIDGEEGGGFLESLMAYRAALMAAVGLALAGAGGFAFWKKRQTAA
jgi:hypothetical protein